MRSYRRIVHLCMGLAALGLCATAARGVIVAEFEHGETDVEVDGYPGMPGDGWESIWEHSANQGVTRSLTVIDGPPLGDAGRALQVAFAHDRNNTRGIVAARRYGAHLAVDRGKPHSIRFRLRLDSGLSDLNDLRVHDDIARNLGLSLGIPSWVVRWRSVLADSGFRFTNGSTSHYVDSNVRLFEGDVYEIRIDILAVETGGFAYLAQIRNLDFETNGRTEGAAFFRSEILELANGGAAVGGFLNFVCYLNPTPDPAEPSTAQFALGRIRINTISPGWLLLGAVPGERGLATPVSAARRLNALLSPALGLALPAPFREPWPLSSDR